MNWDTFLKVFGALIAAIVGISQITNRIPKSRTKLKHDLEILKLIDQLDPQYIIVKNSISYSIRRIYSRNNRNKVTNFRIYNWGEFILGIFLLVLGVSWSIFLLHDGFNWWSIISGIIILAGIGNISMAFEDKNNTIISGEKVKIKKK